MPSAAVAEWERAGSRRRLLGHDIFVLDRAARNAESGPPVLVLHGYPTCSFDWRHVLGALCAHRRVVLLDFVGFGLSDKPDVPYSLFHQADIVEALVAELGLTEIALVTHDMGDSVGGEVLARQIDGDSALRVAERIVTNGSIYIDDAQLTVGQQLLLNLPDEPIDPEVGPTEEMFCSGLASTFSPDFPPDAEELGAQWELVSRGDGHRLLARIIRYIPERRTHEHRWTGAIEHHDSPLRIVWGDADPVAVYDMAQRLSAAVPTAELVTLEGVGHYPMIETPGRFADAVVAGLR